MKKQKEKNQKKTFTLNETKIEIKFWDNTDKTHD